MTIKEFHDNIRLIANIGQSQYFSPEDLDLMINNAIKKFYEQEYAHFEATQKISDTLGFFKSISAAPVTLDANGMANLPTDMYHLSSVEAILEDNSRGSIELIKDSAWLNRKHSAGFAPSTDYPIARQIGMSKIEVAPIGTGNVKEIIMYYLRSPATAKYGYTPNASGTGWTYVEGDSTQVDWPEISHNSVMDKALGFVGTALRDRTLIGSETVQKSQMT